ncbi:M13 family metallopeptidase [Algiphilus aromaticivorans]|uniref:M13 family metallopeptidase n=1 Tax=Algiphilus aromaticivorans TaxID=382454 RepID=UPI0005C13B1D|nr:M13 family metallopeptidase [Algiphilus aromaticivorans]
MPRHIRIVATVLGCALVGTAWPTQAQLQSGVIEANLDREVAPGDDFYRYVNGDWLARTEIPADRSNYGSFSIIQDRTREQLRVILDALRTGEPETPEGRKLGALYASYMDLDAIEARGIAPVQPLLQRIAGLEERAALPGLLAELQQIGVDLPVGLSIYRDARAPDRYALYLSQSGLGLPDREYYLSEHSRFAELRGAYREHVARMLALAGLDRAGERADAIVELERGLADAHWTRVASRDREATYNPAPVDELAEAAPGFDWRAFLHALGEKRPEQVILRQPDAIAATARLLAEADLDTLKSWLAYHALAELAPYLSSPLVAEHFGFHKAELSGVERQKPRWKRALAVVEDAMGEALGKRYVAKHFPPEQRARVQRMVDYLERAYRQRISKLEWMGDATREEALDKLARFSTKIGYPDAWRDYGALEIAADDLFGNVLRARRHEFAYHYGKLGGPIDDDEWFMTPQTVNAYYSPGGNEIVFPAAILQPPFFNPAADDAVNFGAIGAVIGHEIGHGFDDQGSRFDGHGRMRDWWTEADRERFEARTQDLVEQYDAFCPLEDHCVNGALSLGENIGDLGGVSIARLAHRMALADAGRPRQRDDALFSGDIGLRTSPATLSDATIDGYTPAQRFFIGWGQIWARKYREAELINRLNNGPHSPDEFRTNGVVRNIDAWYAAFGVDAEAELYLPPEDRVSIW